MTIDPKTIAADIMCGNARDVSRAEIWAHIGQAYDTTPADASIADKVADLIAKTGIDLIWPDGSKNTELDAARVEIDRLSDRVSGLLASIGANEALSRAAELNEELALSRAQVADLADKLHKAQQENASHTKADTAWANEVDKLRTTLGEIAGMCNCRDDGDCPSLVARRGLADNADNAHANEVASLRRELETAEREAVFGVADAVERIAKVRALCDEYKDQPPPIFQGPGQSEHGKGYNAGTRDMARAVLTALAGEQAEVAR